MKNARKRTARIRRTVRRAIARRRKSAMTSLEALVDEIAGCLGGFAAEAVGDLERVLDGRASTTPLRGYAQRER